MRGNVSGSQWTTPSVGKGMCGASSTVTGRSCLAGNRVVPIDGTPPGTVLLRAGMARFDDPRLAACRRQGFAECRRRAQGAWNSFQAASQSFSVRFSTAPEPHAGSATKARLLSSARMSWVLRARRRANASGRPWAIVCGRIAIESAPPTAAAKACNGRAQYVCLGILFRHHSVGGFRMNGRSRRAGAAQASCRRVHSRRICPYLGNGEELVLIDGKSKADVRSSIYDRLARLFEEPEMASSNGQHWRRVPAPRWRQHCGRPGHRPQAQFPADRMRKSLKVIAATRLSAPQRSCAGGPYPPAWQRDRCRARSSVSSD